MTGKHSSISLELSHRRDLIVDRIKATCGFEEAQVMMNISYPSAKAFDNCLCDFYPEMVEKYRSYGAVTELPWKSHLD